MEEELELLALQAAQCSSGVWRVCRWQAGPAGERVEFPVPVRWLRRPRSAAGCADRMDGCFTYTRRLPYVEAVAVALLKLIRCSGLLMDRVFRIFSFIR
jgi:hypothetical protein